MRRARTATREFLRVDEGIAITGYGLLLALAAILMIGGVTLFASSIKLVRRPNLRDHDGVVVRNST